MTPAIWSFATTLHPENTTLPTAGPSSMGGTMAFPGSGGGNMSSKDRTGGPPAGFGGMGIGGGAASDQKLINYLTANQGTARYLLATIRSTSAESIIVQTNKPVMALGGYLGSDPILTQSQLTSLIKNGTVRYFLLQSPGNLNTTAGASPTQASGSTGTGQMRGNGGGGGLLGGSGQNQQLTSWVQSHCSIVQTNLWSTGSTQANTPAGGDSGVGGQQLYDCSSLH
jgi:4-amino-4-deoxy-L-arabinose transferase-like glycosyltransferase